MLLQLVCGLSWEDRVDTAVLATLRRTVGSRAPSGKQNRKALQVAE